MYKQYMHMYTQTIDQGILLLNINIQWPSTWLVIEVIVVAVLATILHGGNDHL